MAMANAVRRVMVATDGSADATEALEWLGHVPLEATTAIEVVTVLPRPFPSEVFIAERWADLLAESQSVVDDARRRLEKRWNNVTGRVLEGDPRAAIIEAATESHADLIVLGARGLGNVASFLLGSVSLGVTRDAPCAVLVCKGMPRPLRRVSLAVDGSAHARTAVEFFASLPAPMTTSLRILGVVEPLRYPTSAPGFIASTLKAAMEDFENEARGRLQMAVGQAATLLRPRVTRVVTATPTGAPAPTIVRDAETYGCDLIVVGARGLGTLARLALGSVSEAILRQASCPVLIVRPRD